MPPASDRLRDHLRSNESLLGVHSGDVADAPAPRPAAVGVTDHRLLCVAADGAFVSVAYDAVVAVRSRPVTTVHYCRSDYRLFVAVGATLAALGLLAALVLTTGAFAPLFAVLATVAFGAVAYVSHWLPDETIVPPDVVRTLERACDGDDLRRIAECHWPDRWDADAVVLAGTLAFGWVALAVALAASSPAVLLGVAPMLAGLGLVAYGYRHRHVLDADAITRRRRSAVSVRTDDGHTVVVRTEPSTTLDAELGRAALVDAIDARPRFAAESEDEAVV